MRGPTRAVACALTVVVALTSSRGAHAQDVKASAEVLFEDGQRAMKERRFDEACAKFRESLELAPGIGAMLWLADCYEQSGKTASAWAAFREAAAAARARQDSRVKVAERRAKELEPRLSYLTIEIDDPTTETTITRDGQPVPSALRGTAVPVDPGRHVVRATAAGRVPWESTVTAGAQGSKAVVRIPALARAEPSGAPVGAPPTEVQASTPIVPSPSDDRSRWPAQRVLGASFVGVGVVGAALGTAFGLAASSKLDASNADGHCGPGNACDERGIALRADALDLASVSTVSFVVAGVALVGGTLLYLTAPKPRAAAAKATANGLVLSF